MYIIDNKGIDIGYYILDGYNICFMLESFDFGIIIYSVIFVII